MRIENQKQHWPMWWRIAPSVLILAYALSSGFRHWWILIVMCISNAIFWLTQTQRFSARSISVITLEDNKLVIGYQSTSEMIISVSEIEAVINIANKVIIRFSRNEEVQHFELSRSEFDEDSWQKVRRLRNRLMGSR